MDIKDDTWFKDLKRKRVSGPEINGNSYRNYGESTKCVHAGQYDDPNTNAIGTPIFQNSTFYLNDSVYKAIEEGSTRDSFIYSRYGNPSQWAVQEKISSIENAESSIVFSSGMAAISSTILALIEKGAHIVTSRDLYGGTYNLLYEDLQKYGISVSFVDMTNIKEIEESINPKTKLLYFESLSNPLLKFAPIPSLVKLAKENGCRLVIDNTFLTPYNLKVLDLGVDIVINSATKYLGGHSDLIAGTISGSRKLIDQIWPQMLKNGGSLDPHACFLLERSLKTLSLRMRTHNDNALELAHFFQNREEIKKVYYPGMDSHPQYDLINHLTDGKFSGMISFEIIGGDKMALRLLKELKLAKEATSLGGVESLISLPFNTSQASLTKNQKKSIGINEGLIRLSVGIEDIEDLKYDFEQAFNKIFNNN
ncbi:MAG: PLP-dependent transferase [Flavobacteriia bacterium]|nr:PLP-dependent transferase [Flavobacteriia bacterium]